jgi:hypothetical protein
MLEFTDAELRAKAVQLGVIDRADRPMPPDAQSRVKAVLVEERRAAARPADEGPYVGGQITIRPGSIELDGRRLPAASDPVEIHVHPDSEVPSTVRLTLLAHTVQTLKES